MPAPNPADRDPEAIPAFLRQRPGRSSAAERRSARAAGSVDAAPTVDADAEARSGRERLDPASLPLPGLSRRRLASLAGAVAAVWLVLAFGRQVGEASAASDRADDLRTANAALRQDIGQLQSDVSNAQDDRFIRLEARGYGLGGRGEIPFTLAAGAPTLPPDAAGSAGVRLGAGVDHRSPLEVWLSLLFGPQRS